MKTIVVAGTASRVGKTTIASYILRNLSGHTSFIDEKAEAMAGMKYGSISGHAGSVSCGTAGNSHDLLHHKRSWSALKITIRHEGSCPRHTECDTCDTGYEPFSILTRDDIIMEKGKDTERLSNAGACKVVWLQSDSDVEKAGIEAALACFDREHNLVIEGNSYLRVHDADVAILAVSPSVGKIKRSAGLLLNKVDIVVINVHKHHTTEEIEKCRERMHVLGCNVPFYVVNPCMEDDYSGQAFIGRIQDMLSMHGF